ncbi:MAG: cytidine deaminase [Chitinophagaceae bacterium]|jgi:cytidine deaminase|nr:cytidine deaminase [Chitinophagaceae bacterium]
MASENYSFEYEVFASANELSKEDKALLDAAREFTASAYAPYSNFHVAAVARLTNGELVKGTNQENASYPVGTCAERALLGSLGALFPNEPIETMAITYHNPNGSNNAPASPCGMCRQALREYETRTNHSIRLVLAGREGKVYVIPKASMLLPLGFTGDDLK